MPRAKAQAAAPVVRFRVTSYRVNLATAHESDDPVHGRAPSLYVAGPGTGQLGARDYDARIVFVRSRSKLPSPSFDRTAGTSSLFFDIATLPSALTLLEGGGEIWCEVFPLGKRHWGRLAGPLRRLP